MQIERLVYLKKYGRGKATISCEGDPAFHEIIMQILRPCLRVEAIFDLSQFESEMIRKGIPEAVRREYLKTLYLLDDVYLSTRFA